MHLKNAWLTVATRPGSVKGLQSRRPVDFHGVTIGRVVGIKVQFHVEKIAVRKPVLIALDPGQVELIGREASVSPEQAEEDLINAGFRAQLQSQSLLTGELFVNLDFYPDKPARLVGGDEPYPEIPAFPSEIERLQQSASDVAAQLPALLDVLNGLFIDLDQSLDQAGGNFNSIVSDVAEIVHDFRKLTPEVVAGTQAATDDLRRAAQMLEDVIQINRDAIGSMIDEWTVTATAIRRVADQVDRSRAHDQLENRAPCPSGKRGPGRPGVRRDRGAADITADRSTRLR